MQLITEVFAILLSVLVLSLAIKWRTKKFTNLPPSPPKYPIFGNLLQLGQLPHRSLKLLSDTLGPIMLIQLGSIPTLVVSSSDAAKEIFDTHDLSFINRAEVDVGRVMLYNFKDLAFSKYSDYWRNMRTIFVTKLLSNKKVQSFTNIREEEISRLISQIEAAGSSPVNLSEQFTILINDVVCRVAFGKRYSKSGDGKNVTNILDEFSCLLGAFNIADFIPWLAWVNYFNGFNSRVRKTFIELNDIMDQILEEHMQVAKKENKDFVDILLEVQDEGSIDKDGIKAMILDVFSAATETTKTLLEWIIVELVRHRGAMKKVKEEIREVIGDNLNKEEDLKRLTYTKAVIREVMRLHPPVPILLPRVSSGRVNLKGYDIEDKTRLLVNVWAIGMDPTVWDEPEVFRPERFIGSKVDFLGNDFEFIPFGSGRRRCPGISFASSMSESVLVNLLLKFDFVPADGKEPGLDEASGFTIRPKSPLMVIAYQSQYN